MSSPKNQAGFTMPELLTAVMLIGIAVSAGSPAIRRNSGSQLLRLESHKLATQLTAARCEAVSKNEEIRVFITSKSDSGIPVPTGRQHIELDSRINVLSATECGALGLPAAGAILDESCSPVREFVFTPTGTAPLAQRRSIYMSNSFGEVVAVSVGRVGSTSVWRWNQDQWTP